jgi:hypothetical protein
MNENSTTNPVMPRTLYSPKLSDDMIRALYREGQRRRLPMTRPADKLLLRSLGGEFSGMASPQLIAPDQVVTRCHRTTSTRHYDLGPIAPKSSEIRAMHHSSRLSEVLREKSA